MSKEKSQFTAHDLIAVLADGGSGWNVEDALSEAVASPDFVAMNYEFSQEEEDDSSDDAESEE